MLLSGTIACGIVLIIAGLVLYYSFRQFTEKRFDDNLRLSMSDLVAASQFNSEFGLQLRWRPSNPAFNSPLSGWYWIIHAEDGSTVFSSDSLMNDPATWLKKINTTVSIH
ncbi:MAG: hypothetical protein ACI8P9_003680 [Parasphingorhabdus sp.]|jgi:hypothetical protein